MEKLTKGKGGGGGGAKRPSQPSRPSRPSAPKPSAPKRPSISGPAGGSKPPIARTPSRPVTKPQPTPPKAPQPVPKAPNRCPPQPVAKTPQPVPKAPQPVPKAPQPKIAQPAPPTRTSGAPLLKSADRAQQKQVLHDQRRSYTNLAGVAVAGAAGVAVAGAVAGVGVQEQLDGLSQRLAALQQAAALVDIYRDLDSTDSTLLALPSEVQAARTRGYVYHSYLENKVEVLSEQWANVRRRVETEIDRRSSDLAQDVNAAQRALEMAYSSGGAQIARAENAIRQLESKVAAAQDAIEGMYNTIDENVTQVISQLEAINKTLDLAQEASFDFYEGEDFVDACDAQLIEMGQEGPKGILHLTDSRLIFEQKEDIATKKVLFITTAKERVQKMLFEVPVGYVDEMKVERSGLLGGRQTINFRFHPDARYNEVALRLRGGANNQEWIRLIQRAKSGDLEKERVGASAAGAAQQEEQMVATVEELPTKCVNCGALLTTPIVRGMREVRCEYCGTVIRR